MNRTTRTDHDRSERDWDLMKALMFALMALTIGVLAPGIARSSSSRAVVARTDVQVRATQACERNTDRDRSPTRTLRRYSSSNSMPFRRWAYRLWAGRARRACGKVRYLNAVPSRAVVYVFSRVGQAEKALSVFTCESHIWPYARNGQYLGLAQMGEYARSRYGHSWDALGQSWSAYFYYRDAGWGPWACA